MKYNKYQENNLITRELCFCYKNEHKSLNIINTIEQLSIEHFNNQISLIDSAIDNNIKLKDLK